MVEQKQDYLTITDDTRRTFINKFFKLEKTKRE